MPLPPLADRLGYAFLRPALLAQALTHRSHSACHNERLEFVGDAVLNCVVGLILYERHPDIPEGELSRVRANLVNGEVLARLATTLDLVAELRLGDGEQRAGAARPSILADALEAVFGAVFVDGGFAAARAVIERVYGDELGPYQGRIKHPRELAVMATEHGEFRVYVVEVCTDCSWNHLTVSFVLGDGEPRPALRARRGDAPPTC